MHSYKTKKSKVKIIIAFLNIFLIVFILIIYLYKTYKKIEVKNVKYDNSNFDVKRTNLTLNNKENESITDIIEEVQKSIVGISKIKDNGSTVFLDNSTSQLGIGTGVIITENGYIVTNWHVAGNKYSNCYITTESGKLYNGTVVWADDNIDLAIVKINAKALHNIKLGDSDLIRIAENVYAIGNPIGYEFQRTVTSRNNKCIK